jgi:hypothetical protein
MESVLILKHKINDTFVQSRQILLSPPSQKRRNLRAAAACQGAESGFLAILLELENPCGGPDVLWPKKAD